MSITRHQHELSPRLHTTLETCCEQLKASYDSIGSSEAAIDPADFATARSTVREFNLHKSVANGITKAAKAPK